MEDIQIAVLGLLGELLLQSHNSTLLLGESQLPFYLERGGVNFCDVQIIIGKRGKILGDC